MKSIDTEEDKDFSKLIQRKFDWNDFGEKI